MYAIVAKVTVLPAPSYRQRPMRNWRRLVLLVAVDLSVGCATGARPRDGTASRPVLLSNDVLTAAEISRWEPNEMLLTVIRRLRPRFLASRHETPAVFIDGIQVLQMSDLATVFASSVFDVTLVHGMTVYSAMTSTGRVVTGNVLLIRTRRPPR
jgi:hypothetical protein